MAYVKEQYKIILLGGLCHLMLFIAHQSMTLNAST